MKRMSLCVVLLAWLPGITSAYYGCCGGVRYSPYALNYYSSGLVSDYAEYTPYAFGYNHSGLVPFYCTTWDLGYGYGCGFPVAGFHGRSSAHVAPHVSGPVHRSAQAPSHPTRPPVCSAPPRRDGMDVIRQHLRTRSCDAARVDRIFRVGNELVSADIFVKDRNLLIKYWNPEERERLGTRDAAAQKAYAKYQQDWERFAEQYRKTGGEIYTVSAATPETIVAALDSCPKLSPAGDSQATVMYAKD